MTRSGAEPARAWLGLGSNVGDREQNLRSALRHLGAVLRVDRVSSVYASAPVGYTEQPEFLNLVVEARTFLEPLDLLRELKRIERALGRIPSFRDAPRTIDIDVLLYGDSRVEEPELRIPHPRMLERSFVLLPLAELAPDDVHPVSGGRYGELAKDALRFGHAARVAAGETLLDRTHE